MTVGERIRICILLEKMERQKEYSEKLGIENCSRIITQIEEEDYVSN